MPPKKKKSSKRESGEKEDGTAMSSELEAEASVMEIGQKKEQKICLLTGEPYGPKTLHVVEKLEDDLSDDEPESESEDESRCIQGDQDGEVPAEFWHLQKLIKYLKAGDQTATMVSLCLLKDFELSSRVIQRTIQGMGGLEVLVNIMETRDLPCQLGALSVVLPLSITDKVRRTFVDFGIVTPLIQMLKHPARDIQVLATETLANIALTRKARKQIRVRGGVPLVLDIMDVPDHVLQLRTADGPVDDPEKKKNDRELLKVAIGGAKVLDSISCNPKIKEELRKHGAVFLMARFLKSNCPALIVPTMGAVQQCADLKSCRLAFEHLGIISDVVRHLADGDANLKKNCALAIFKCAESEETRDMVRKAGGLDPLCDLVRDSEVRLNKKLLAAVTGAIWKCAISPKNVSRFNQNGLVGSIVSLLEENEDEDVLTNVAGALAECCKDPSNCDVLRGSNGLPKLIRLLSSTHEPLLENLPLVLYECAHNEHCLDIINDPEHVLDGVRLVWSLLKHQSDVVKRNACHALVPCIKYAKDAPEMVRAFVGGLELTVSLLESQDTQVLSAVCATIAAIALDPENLGILTDHGVVKKLADLVNTKDEHLRANLTLAIAYCSEWGQNNYEFGRLNAVAPLVNYMHSKNKDVLKGVCIALYHLSKEPSNCVTMHACGVVKHILRVVASDDPEVQLAAATTIRHIRKLALTAEKFAFKEISSLHDTDYRI